MNKKLSSHHLTRGDKVGLIAPAGSITTEQLHSAIENMKNLGLLPVYSNGITSEYGYLAGTDNRRLTEFHNMFAASDIKAVICVRGGYGTMRLLPDINFDIVRQNPKIFVGYSDITALLNNIYQKTGLVTYHAPMAASVFSPTVEYFYKKTFFNIQTPRDFKMTDDDAFTIASGKATGKLCGGNLALVASLCGTPYEVEVENKIVFLEEIGEDPYRIDRLITQLLLTGKLQKASGIILGNFNKCEPDDEETTARSRFSSNEILREKLAGLGIPVFKGIKAGHVVDNIVLPIGAEVEIDADKCEYRISNFQKV